MKFRGYFKNRGSRPGVSVKKDLLFLKKRPWHWCFPVKTLVCKICENTFSYKTPPMAASVKNIFPLFFAFSFVSVF